MPSHSWLHAAARSDGDALGAFQQLRAELGFKPVRVTTVPEEGTRVVLRGLKAEELNGKAGVVVGATGTRAGKPPGEGRAAVSLDGETKPRSLHSDNLAPE